MDFALVHGAYHGAWCWDLLRPELERAGHRVITMDLPISDAAAGASAYADAVEAALSDSVDPIVVAHSMAGLVVPIVAARRPVRRLVFLASVLPSPGLSANDQREREPIDGRVPPATSQWTDLGEDVWEIGPQTAAELFYTDVPAATVQWAVGHLRPQCYRAFREVTPLASWPDVPSSVIVCRDDRSFDPEWIRSSARERLGVTAIEIDGAHSPFLTRPGELAAILDGLA